MHILYLVNHASPRIKKNPDLDLEDPFLSLYKALNPYVL
jgi:hypothetical protein